MKKALLVCLLLLFCLSAPAAAAEAGEIFVDPASKWLVRQQADGTMEVLADRYVLSWYREEGADTLYYTALEDGQPRLYALIPQEGRASAENLRIFQEEGSELTLLSTPNKSTEKLVEAAMGIIYREEGNYGSVNKDDNGALSIGKVQWHANRALDLLKTIVEANPENARSILGEDLYWEIVTVDSWGSRTVNEEEALAISTLLTTAEGKAAQDAQATLDITSYVNHAVNLGLRSSTAIVYFADLENQWGYSRAKDQAEDAMVVAGSYEKVTLAILHQACLDYTSNYHDRRNRVYQYCLSLGWDEFAIDTPGRPTVSVEGSEATLSWGAVEGALSYVCYIVLPQAGYPNACDPIETTGTTCTVQLEAGRVYWAYVVAKGAQSASDASLWCMVETEAGAPRVQAAVTQADGACTVTVSLYNVPEPCVLIVAGYSGGRLTAVQTAGGSSAGSTVTLTGTPDQVRVMVVDSLTTCKPVCGAAIVDQNEFLQRDVETGA